MVTALTVCVLHDIDALKRPIAHMRTDIREAFEIPNTIDIPDEDGDGDELPLEDAYDHPPRAPAPRRLVHAQL